MQCIGKHLKMLRRLQHYNEREVLLLYKAGMKKLNKAMKINTNWGKPQAFKTRI